MKLPTPPFLLAMAAVLALATFSALADDTLTWVHPTQYMNAAPLDPAEIESTEIRFYASATSTAILGSVSVPAPAATVVIPRNENTVLNQCYQAATRVLPAFGGAQSAFAPAARVCVANSPNKPKSPTALSGV